MRAAVSGRMPKLPRPVSHRVTYQTGLAWDSPLPRSQLAASMLMLVETSFRILGYPGFAMIFFLLAALAGVGLVVNILASDVKPPKKPDE